jgi:hypothetical protein
MQRGRLNTEAQREFTAEGQRNRGAEGNLEIGTIPSI